jgi:putative ABC transport system permease protein
MDMMGFKIVDGRSFIKGSETEDGNYICNEAAANAYGWKVGDKLRNGQLVGIMKDFNLVSLRENVDPFVFSKVSAKNNFRYASIKFSEGHNKEVLSLVQKVYNEMIPSDPLRAFFLDDHLNLLYINENQQARLISFFSLLSVIVSVLGTLGLSIFLCQRKVKEIGIRKVNGAQVTEIMAMLNRDFVKWVVLAFVIATPLAWFAMHKWLGGFAYKTNLSWWIFALAGILALGIALLTISWQSWRAATRNPIEALRYE